MWTIPSSIRNWTADQKRMETIVRANHPLGRWFLVRSNYFRIAGTSSRMPDEHPIPSRSTATGS
jgi:hypothetical protein